MKILQAAGFEVYSDISWTRLVSVPINPSVSSCHRCHFEQSILFVRPGPGRRHFRSIHPYQAWVRPASFSVDPFFSSDLDQAGVVFDQSIIIRLGTGRRHFQSIHSDQTWASAASFSIKPSFFIIKHKIIIMDRDLLVISHKLRSCHERKLTRNPYS